MLTTACHAYPPRVQSSVERGVIWNSNPNAARTSKRVWSFVFGTPLSMPEMLAWRKPAIDANCFCESDLRFRSLRIKFPICFAFRANAFIQKDYTPQSINCQYTLERILCEYAFDRIAMELQPMILFRHRA